jgi:hypothetical protein
LILLVTAQSRAAVPGLAAVGKIDKLIDRPVTPIQVFHPFPFFAS